jgi:hypothetical protein
MVWLRRIETPILYRLQLCGVLDLQDGDTLDELAL